MRVTKTQRKFVTGGIVAKNKTLSAAGPEEGEAKSSRAAKDTASQSKPPSSGASVARCGTPLMTLDSDDWQLPTFVH